MLGSGSCTGAAQPGGEFEAWVAHRDTGERLNEYGVTHHPAEGSQPAWTECFLETIDEPFKIVISQPNPSRRPGNRHRLRERKGIQCRFNIDGKRIKKGSLYEGEKEYRFFRIFEDDINDGKKSTASLKFAPLTTTDDPSKVTIDNEKALNLGIIEVTLCRGKWFPNGIRSSRTHSIPFGNDVADEKSKKFSYTVGTSDRKEIVDQPHQSYRFQQTGPDAGDYRFVFKYRPRAVLIQSGIINEPPPPAEEVKPNPPKRRRSSAQSETIVLSDDEDRKPNLENKRVKYLEAQVKRLSSQLNHMNQGGRSRVDAVDLTMDDD